MGRVLLGIVLGVILVAATGLLYLRFGSLPVAVSDSPFPEEKLLTHFPLHARIDRELVKSPPIQPDEDNLVAGAHIYSDQCAVCHGFHGQSSRIGSHMFPSAPALWEKHHNGPVVGVSDDPPGETYWKVNNGIRLTGMPSYKNILTETQMWQVSLLLANADKPLPPGAVAILRGETSTLTAAPAASAPVQQAK